MLHRTKDINFNQECFQWNLLFIVRLQHWNMRKRKEEKQSTPPPIATTTDTHTLDQEPGILGQTVQFQDSDFLSLVKEFSRYSYSPCIETGHLSFVQCMKTDIMVKQIFARNMTLLISSQRVCLLMTVCYFPLPSCCFCKLTVPHLIPFIFLDSFLYSHKEC